MTGNRCVVYMGPGKVEVHDIGFPELSLPEQNRKVRAWRHPQDRLDQHLRQRPHMVRGRTTAPLGQTLGHEITRRGCWKVGRTWNLLKRYLVPCATGAFPNTTALLTTNRKMT